MGATTESVQIDGDMFDCLQEAGLALGAQAGEARIRDVVETGGFARFRRVAETPFNLVFEVRP